MDSVEMVTPSHATKPKQHKRSRLEKMAKSLAKDNKDNADSNPDVSWSSENLPKTTRGWKRYARSQGRKAKGVAYYEAELDKKLVSPGSSWILVLDVLLVEMY